MEYKTLRVPVPLFERATALLPEAGKLPEIQVSGGSADEAKVLRAALVRGLDALEKELMKSRSKRDHRIYWSDGRPHEGKISRGIGSRPVHFLYRSARGLACDYYACNQAPGEGGPHRQTTSWSQVTCPDCLAKKGASR